MIPFHSLFPLYRIILTFCNIFSYFKLNSFSCHKLTNYNACINKKAISYDPDNDHTEWLIDYPLYFVLYP